MPYVATPLWDRCEDETRTPKSGKLESSGTLKNLKLEFKGQNTLHWSVLHINGKVLKCRCPKWPRMCHMDICSPSYGQKKGWKSNWQFDSQPLLDVCWKSATWRWKALEESYKFGLDLTPIRGQSRKIWAPKVPRLQLEIVSGLLLGGPGKKNHLNVASNESCREYYMGEGRGFPRVRAVVNQVSPSARGLSQHPRVFPNVK